jgi:hypothetical protein
MIYAIAIVGKITRPFNCGAATSIFYPPGGSIIKTDHKND